jgi:hypothetical protein
MDSGAQMNLDMPTGESSSGKNPIEAQNAERAYDEKRRELVLELLRVLDNLDRTIAAAQAASTAQVSVGVQSSAAVRDRHYRGLGPR